MIHKLSSAVIRNLSKRWYNMIARCTNPDHKNYPTYGGDGVVISARWLDKHNFIKDAVNLPGYDEKLLLSGKLWLDKDSLVPGNKIYDRQFCCFLDKENSNLFKPNQMKLFKAISPEGIVYESYNQTAFAKEHGLSQTVISECLRGVYTGSKGWKFMLVE